METNYYSDGSSEETWTYLYTECNEDSDGGGGGGGGAGDTPPQDPEDPEEDNDQEISRDFNYSTSETSLGDEDLVVNPGGATGEEDGNGNPTGPYYLSVSYEYRVTVALLVQTGEVVSAYQHDVIARPNNETYDNPSGGSVTRVVTPVTTSPASAPFSGNTVSCNWVFTVVFRYTYLPSRVTTSKSFNKSYSAVVTVH